MSGTLRALVVYESMFGNTQQIAEAIAEGLRDVAGVELVAVGAAPSPLPTDVDLVVVGGPTHAFGMTRPATRADASTQGPVVMSPDRGIREWLNELPGSRGSVATFDTRVGKVRRLPGSAAHGAARALRHRGFGLLTKPESFFVEDVQGPLQEGEVGRARRWGQRLGHELRSTRDGNVEGQSS